MTSLTPGAPRRLWIGRSSPTVNAGLAGRDNSLGLLRLVLAGSVMVSHAFILGGFGHDPGEILPRGRQSLGVLAVFGFFAISGYLVTKSGMRSDILVFLWHRILRIFPAFWVVLGVAALIVGPIAFLASGRSLGDYFGLDERGPFSYLLLNVLLTIRQYGIGDVFVNTPYGHDAGSVLNGSLWTLDYEFFCYLVIAVLVVLGIAARPIAAKIVLPLLTLIVAVTQFGIVYGGVNLLGWVPLLDDPMRLTLVFVFLIGGCLAVFSRSIPLNDIAALVAAAIFAVTLVFDGLPVFGLPAIGYLALWLAARLPARLHWIGAKNDYSYGIYVYGFLMQQVFAALGVPAWGYVPYLLISIIAAAGCAWLSWHLVEKWALAIKDRGPGRGIRHWWDALRRPRSRPVVLRADAVERLAHRHGETRPDVLGHDAQ